MIALNKNPTVQISKSELDTKEKILRAQLDRIIGDRELIEAYEEKTRTNPDLYESQLGRIIVDRELIEAYEENVRASLDLCEARSQ